MTRTTPLARLAGALVAAGLLAAGCSVGADHNDADVAFAQGMLPHHEQAVEMADLAESRSTDPDVLDLAARIEAEQAPEIDTLTGWLDEWGAEEHGAGHGSMDDASMGGMMSETDMAALEAASGPEFDRLFLEQMVAHHTGAVEMARTEVEDGEDADAVALATSIEESQRAEIDEMKDLLATLGS